MLIQPTPLPDLFTIDPMRHGDDRGWFSEVFRTDLFRDRVADVEFVQENRSLSARAGTIRGLHFQTPPRAQGKLVSCIAGALWDVAVDLRPGPGFGCWHGEELSADNGRQFWIPAGFAHGFCTRAPDTVISYKVTEFYAPECDSGIAWDGAGVTWPDIADPGTLSAKDRAAPGIDAVRDVFA
jgi:dTDP-4-dehydrorhamnose 3,5-epimerase